MSRVPTPTPLLLELLALFDRAQQSIAGAENIRLQGIPGWELFRGEVPYNPLLEPWLERVGDAGFYVKVRFGWRNRIGWPLWRLSGKGRG